MYAVNKNKRAMPVTIKLGNNFDNTLSIIGKGLKSGMKILVPQKEQKIKPAQVVKLGKEVKLSTSR
ncbi:MAG: hypothetical protein GY750_17730 [Lentisphaerae bacterium]|nr:hypothetical protein [Lentisphaerota bacterium]MCP4103240.1 hypothetical protein [Lentisphaerota bacterium]